MDLDHALRSHVEWKVTFRMAMFEQGTVDADCVGRDDCCELGKWFHGEGRTRFEGVESFEACLARHQEFHAEAGRIARAINAARYDEAAELMRPNSRYTLTSSALGHALVAMCEEVGCESQEQHHAGPGRERAGAE